MMRNLIVAVLLGTIAGLAAPEGHAAEVCVKKLNDICIKYGQAPKPVKPKPVAPKPSSPARPDPSRFKDCSTCPELVVIPGGEFEMGSPSGESDRGSDEGPQRIVRVERFALARTEVTVGAFRQFVRETGHSPGKGCGALAKSWERPGFSQTDAHPVTCVDWEDAQAYIGWLNGKVSGSPYRLPSEAEWEYAARAGTETAYPWGSRWNADKANGRDGGPGRTVPVASYPANGFGLSDMIGNVWEWTEDCWHPSYANAPRTGIAWLEAGGGDCTRRVVRGGSWFDGLGYLRSALRYLFAREFRGTGIGFRPARTLTP